MKNQNGFIQIPILILIVVGIAILGGVGYFVIHGQSNTPDSPIVATSTANSETSSPDSISETHTSNEGNSHSATIQIQSASHISVDLCTNISGTQTSVPAGMSVNGTICSAIPQAQVIIPVPVVDVCMNIEGVQTTAPTGMTIQTVQFCSTACSYTDCPSSTPADCTSSTICSSNSQIVTQAQQQPTSEDQNSHINTETYTNNTYGFSFEYPEDMACEESTRNGPAVGNNYGPIYDYKLLTIRCGHKNLNGGVSDESAGQLSLYIDNGSSEYRSMMQNIATESYTAQVGANKFYDFSNGHKSLLRIFKSSYVLEVQIATSLVPPSHIDLASLTL